MTNPSTTHIPEPGHLLFRFSELPLVTLLERTGRFSESPWATVQGHDRFYTITPWIARRFAGRIYIEGQEDYIQVSVCGCKDGELRGEPVELARVILENQPWHRENFPPQVERTMPVAIQAVLRHAREKQPQANGEFIGVVMMQVGDGPREAVPTPYERILTSRADFDRMDSIFEARDILTILKGATPGEPPMMALIAASPAENNTRELTALPSTAAA